VISPNGPAGVFGEAWGAGCGEESGAGDGAV
jgi:hypothetical protein